MPKLENSGRSKWAVYWRKAGDDAHANPVMLEPVELRVRWGSDASNEGKGTVSILDTAGDKVRYDVAVIVAIDVPVYSQLWLGRLCDWLSASSSGVDEDVMEVAAKSYIDDVKGRSTRRLLYLRRFKQMPGATS